MTQENPVEGERSIVLFDRLVLEGLTQCFVSHQSLGARGKEKIMSPLGKTALLADIEAEEVIIDKLRENNIPIKVVSEEHGVVDLGGVPKFLGTLDGIDGTAGYEGGQGRYGTMFAVSEGADPRYDDYLVSAVLEYPSGQVFMASKGQGAFVIKDDQRSPIHTSGSTKLDMENSRLYIDAGFTGATQPFENALDDFSQRYMGYVGDPPSWGPDSIFLADLAKGESDIVLLFTGKDNLEIASAFGLVKEAGGDMVDYQEEVSIGEKKYLEFERTQHRPVVAAATRELALQFIHHLKARKREVHNYFTRLGLQMRPALRLHKLAGLWERTPEHKRDWGNVSEHCLAEAARAEVFADLFGFDPELKKDLKIAAALHDYFKKREKKITREGNNTEGAFGKAEAESSRMLTEAGFSQRVIYFVSGTGTVESIKVETPRLLAKQQLSEDEIAYLILHYIDDYTTSDPVTMKPIWVRPAETLPNGVVVNAFDKRMDFNDVRYPELKAEGFIDFQRNVGHLVEERLAQILSQQSGSPVKPKELPEIVEQDLRERIRNSQPSVEV